MVDTTTRSADGEVGVMTVLTPRDALGKYAFLRCTHFSPLELVIVGDVRFVPKAL